MSTNRFKAQTDEITTGTAVKTIIQLVAATNHAVRIDEIAISFKGIVSTSAPILVEVLRQTTAGTMTALTPVKDPEFSETIQTTAQHTATAEPTAGDILMKEEIHPQTGFLFQCPFGREIRIPGGGRLGIRVTAGVSVSCVARICGEE